MDTQFKCFLDENRSNLSLNRRVEDLLLTVGEANATECVDVTVEMAAEDDRVLDTELTVVEIAEEIIQCISLL